MVHLTFKTAWATPRNNNQAICHRETNALILVNCETVARVEVMMTVNQHRTVGFLAPRCDIKRMELLVIVVVFLRTGHEVHGTAVAIDNGSSNNADRSQEGGAGSGDDCAILVVRQVGWVFSGHWTD